MEHVANIILNQIRITDRWALLAWGAKNYLSMEKGVIFSISTPLYKSGVKVEITLSPLDTYNITVFRETDGQRQVLETLSDVYCDTLVEALDSLIEKDKKKEMFVL
ncbi:hypothetical protein ACFYKX_25600 [Cytobacillus sp. FJAT-54145]|uniref:Uncharacterized protein n=1 Tax=Cytobacillus spartinae TaxID=3299023 RepID=A0ABW6KMJ2_9BACI